MTTSYENGLTYEAARELINSRIGSLSTLIGDEEAKASPDASVIDGLRAERRALVVEREDLRSDDPDAVRAVIAKYRRPPNTAPVPTLNTGA